MDKKQIKVNTLQSYLNSQLNPIMERMISSLPDPLPEDIVTFFNQTQYFINFLQQDKIDQNSDLEDYVPQRPIKRQMRLTVMEEVPDQIPDTQPVKKSQEIHKWLSDNLKKHILFQQLSDDLMDQLIDLMQPQSFEQHDVILQQGEEGFQTYLLFKGTCNVFEDDVQIFKYLKKIF